MDDEEPYVDNLMTFDEFNQKADTAGRRAAVGAIRDGWSPVTIDVPDGTIITSFLCAGFRRVQPDKYIVRRNPDGTVGLFTAREDAYRQHLLEKHNLPLMSLRNLDPAMVDQYAIDPSDARPSLT